MRETKVDPPRSERSWSRLLWSIVAVLTVNAPGDSGPARYPLRSWRPRLLAIGLVAVLFLLLWAIASMSHR